MQYTSREIIERAKDLSQTTNSKAFSFSLLTNLLNNAYTKLYNDLSGMSNAFIEYFTLSSLSINWLSQLIQTLHIQTP